MRNGLHISCAFQEVAPDVPNADQPSHPSPPAPGYVIPDFEKDAASRSALEQARVLYIRREMHDADVRLRAQFSAKRDEIRAQAAATQKLLDERTGVATSTLAAYAARYPHHVHGNRPAKPSAWEIFISLGGAQRLYRAAADAAKASLDTYYLRRRRVADEEELEQALIRALHLAEEAIRKNLDTQEGAEHFYRRPGIELLRRRCEEIAAERAEYAARLASGRVSPLEQRDRMFAERNILPLRAPFAQTLIVRVLNFGQLAYFLLRDGNRQLFSLSYDPRLEDLHQHVFDVYRIVDRFEVKLTRSDAGTPLSAFAHYCACYPDVEDARDEFRQSRLALQQPRSLPATPPRDEHERAVIELLAQFARSVGPAAPSPINFPES